MNSNEVCQVIVRLFICGLLFVAWNCETSTTSDQSVPGDTSGVSGASGWGNIGETPTPGEQFISGESTAPGEQFISGESTAPGEQPISQLPLCPMDNVTRQCTCDTETGPVQGRQVCYTFRGWGRCECYEVPSSIIKTDDTPVPDPVINKGPESFNWNRTTPTGGECLAGHYKGEFTGQYSPALTMTFGIFDITGTVEFDLFETGNGEFLEIKNGVMEGVAIDTVPFVGEIVGTLDCATGWAEAYLINCMYVVAVVLPALFEGPAYGIYDKINHVFVDGVWSVTEEDLDGNYPEPLPVHPGDPLPQIGILTLTGGVGTWSASFVQ